MSSITRKTQASRTERRKAISERLLHATEELLAEDLSYTEISVERLCAGADISRSTFYAYFEDKGHLLRELTVELLNELGAIAAEWWDEGPAITYGALREIIGRLVATYAKHQALLAAISDTAVYDPAVRDVWNSLIQGFAGEISQMIELAEKEGSLPVQGAAHETAELLTWMTVHSYYQLVRGADEAKLERIADANTEILWVTVHGRDRGES